MNLKTFPIMYYGYNIDETNNIINFDEGSGELSAAIQPGNYSFEQLMVQIKNALDLASTLPQAYFVTALRSTRKVQITAAANFDLLISSGTQAGVSPWSLLGFTNGDMTGGNDYTGDSASGDVYRPQFLLQDFTHPDKDVTYVDSSINESTNGDTQVVSFGLRRFMSFSMKFITNQATDGFVIRHNPYGEEDTVAFLQACITKSPLEIMLDEAAPNAFITLLLESTSASSDGTGYTLRAMTSNNLPDYYETGILRFRVIEQ